MPIKIWQICRVLREIGLKQTILTSAISADINHTSLVAGLSDYDNMVRLQNRTFLDAEIDDEVVRAVLAQSNFVFFSSPRQGDANTLIVRSYRRSGEDREISPVTAFNLLGGSRLEEVFEFGSASVSGVIS